MFKKMVLAIMLVGGALALSGCWDTVMTMSPGETIELDEMTFGDDYVINSCQVTRTAPNDVVIINTESLSIFSEVRRDENQAREKYLFRIAEVTGLVTEVNNYDRIVRDNIEITIADKTARCYLNSEFTEAQLNSMLGKIVSIKGKIEEVSSIIIYLYDSNIVPTQ